MQLPGVPEEYKLKRSKQSIPRHILVTVMKTRNRGYNTVNSKIRMGNYIQRGIFKIYIRFITSNSLGKGNNETKARERMLH